MVSRAIASNKGKPFILRKGISTLSDLRDGASTWGYPGDYPGRIYYVNNIHGASTNDGLCWDQPFAQVSEAITASEAYRATHASGNDNIANRIFIQGTNTVYTGITDTGERCDYIGISAGTVYDVGSGQPRIGAATTDGVDDASNMRGCGWYNLQFQFGGSSTFGFRNTAWIQRSRFIECCFMMVAVSGTACLSLVGSSGTLFERNNFASNAAGQPTYGVTISGQHSDSFWYQNNFAAGSTALFNLGSATHSVNTVIQGNFFNASGGHTASFVDASAGGYAMLAGNYFGNKGSDPINRVVDTNNVGNMVAGTADFVST
jgi:hypothetical protein